MRTLTIMWIAGLLLVGCGGGGSSTGGKQEGRIYVENAWGQEGFVGQACVWARLERVDDQVIESELKEMPSQGGPLEVTSEPVPGGSTATVHIRFNCLDVHDWHLPFEVNGSIVVRITQIVLDAHDIRYEVRSYG